MNAGKSDFGIIIKNKNGGEVVKYLISKGYFNPNNYKGICDDNSYYYITAFKNEIKCLYRNPTSKTYTLEEFKNIVNGNTIHECW